MTLLKSFNRVILPYRGIFRRAPYLHKISSGQRLASGQASDWFSILEFMENNSGIGAMQQGTIFSDTGPIIFTAELLCALKDFEGVTWVQFIIGTTIITRLLTGLPVAIAQQRAIRRLEIIQPEIKKLAEELKKETGYAIKKFGWDEKTAKRQFTKSFNKHWRKIMEVNNCHPMKSLCLALIQMPIWICFSSGLRNIVYGLPLPRTEEQGWRWFELFSDGGLPWVENLTTSDPYVLPVIFLVVNISNIFLHSWTTKKIPVVKSKLQKALPWVFTGCIVGISGFATVVPSAVTLYWATSSSVALTQNILLMHPGLRKKLKMPTEQKDQNPSTPTSINITEEIQKSRKN